MTDSQQAGKRLASFPGSLPLRIFDSYGALLVSKLRRSQDHEVGLVHHEVGLVCHEVGPVRHEVGLVRHEVGIVTNNAP